MVSDQIRIFSQRDVARLERQVRHAFDKTFAKIRKLLRTEKTISFFYELKFSKIGVDPLDHDQAMNFIEQLNQGFSYLAALRGTSFLLKRHSNATPYLLARGAASGHDIFSEDRTVVAEAFAATNPTSNDKLRKEIRKLSQTTALHKYVFYLSPVGASESALKSGIEVIQVHVNARRDRAG